MLICSMYILQLHSCVEAMSTLIERAADLLFLWILAHGQGSNYRAAESRCSCLASPTLQGQGESFCPWAHEAPLPSWHCFHEHVPQTGSSPYYQGLLHGENNLMWIFRYSPFFGQPDLGYDIPPGGFFGILPPFITVPASIHPSIQASRHMYIYILYVYIYYIYIYIFTCICICVGLRSVTC